MFTRPTMILKFCEWKDCAVSKAPTPNWWTSVPVYQYRGPY